MVSGHSALELRCISTVMAYDQREDVTGVDRVEFEIQINEFPTWTWAEVVRKCSTRFTKIRLVEHSFVRGGYFPKYQASYLNVKKQKWGSGFAEVSGVLRQGKNREPVILNVLQRLIYLCLTNILAP